MHDEVLHRFGNSRAVLHVAGCFVNIREDSSEPRIVGVTVKRKACREERVSKKGIKKNEEYSLDE